MEELRLEQLPNDEGTMDIFQGCFRPVGQSKTGDAFYMYYFKHQLQASTARTSDFLYFNEYVECVFNHDTSYPLHMEFVESCKLTTAIHSCADDFKVVLERFLDLLQHSECLLSQHQILSVKMLDRQLLCRTQMKFQTTPDPAIVDHLPKRWLVLVKSLCHVQIIYTDQ